MLSSFFSFGSFYSFSANKSFSMRSFTHTSRCKVIYNQILKLLRFMFILEYCSNKKMDLFVVLKNFFALLSLLLLALTIIFLNWKKIISSFKISKIISRSDLKDSHLFYFLHIDGWMNQIIKGMTLYMFTSSMRLSINNRLITFDAVKILES